jgi:hypothetical protein
VARRSRAHRRPRSKKVFMAATSAAREWHRAWRGRQELTRDGRARVRGRAGSSGWHSSAVRGSDEPSAASGGGV